LTPFAPTPFDLVLYDSVKHSSGGLRNLDATCAPTWRRSIRAVGGYWLGTCQFAGTPADQLAMFMDGLGRELRESVGSQVTWQGFLVQAELTTGGQTYVRRWLDLANRVQTIYTKLGDNQFTNGSVESGAWAAYNSPTVLAQSTTWISDGAFSCHIIANATNGAIIQTGITIVAAKAYDCQVAVNIISGTWKLEIYAVSTGSVLGSGSENNGGQRTMRASVMNTNTFAGAIGVRLVSQTAAAEMYGDGATFRETPLQARTAWYTDSTSQLEYGTLELALLQGSMADATANAHAATALAEHKWPRTVPPVSFGGNQMLAQPDGLTLTFAGYAWSLRNKYVASTRAGTTQNASTHVTNLIGDAEFVTAAKIQANTFQYQIDDRAPLRVWDVLAAITQAGDASWNRWTCGVYNNRAFQYLPASTTPDYHYRAGQLLTPASDPILPWLAQPGLVYLDDLPVGPGSLSANRADDPHVLFVEEVEFDAAAYLADQGGLTFQMVAGADQAA